MHSTNNDLADSATDPNGPEYNGQVLLGELLITKMNQLGIIVDVSHASDEASMIFGGVQSTHNCKSFQCEAVTDHQRNMSDEMLRLIAQTRVVQLTMLSDYLRDVPQNVDRDAALVELRSTRKLLVT